MSRCLFDLWSISCQCQLLRSFQMWQVTNLPFCCWEAFKNIGGGSLVCSQLSPSCYRTLVMSVSQIVVGTCIVSFHYSNRIFFSKRQHIERHNNIAYIFWGFVMGGRSFWHIIPWTRSTISSWVPASSICCISFQQLCLSTYTGIAVVDAPSACK